MVSIKIDNVTISHEFPIEFINDGTEEYNVGTLKIKNLTQREAFEDYADVEITLGSTTYEFIIQKDISTYKSENQYEHEITLAEPTIKLANYFHADRLYTTWDGDKVTYLFQLQNLLLTLNFGKTSPFTIATATSTLLNTEAQEKEYSGGSFLTTLTDMFRSVKAVPKLDLDGVIGHEMIGSLNNSITVGDIIAETITSDIADYAMGVHAKVKNATYEADLITGGTYYPSKSYGVTPRSLKTKFDDKEAIYILDSGIRRMIDARLLNVTIFGEGDVEANITEWIIPKEEWDNLELERDEFTLLAGKYQNNTFYFEEGDNTIQNVGVHYKNDTALLTGDDAMEWVIKSWIYNSSYSYSDYVAQPIKEMEMKFYYAAQRDMDVRTERHDISRVTKNATMFNNQKDSKLELQRFGTACESLVNRVGNDKYEITKRYNSLVPYTLFELNDYDSNLYKVVKQRFLIRQNSMDVTYLFVKNASIINPTTSVNRTVNPFTITKRNILSNFAYNEYLEFSGTNRTDDGLLELKGRKALFNALAYAAANVTPIYNAQYISAANSVVIVNLSATCFPFGNTLIANAQFKSPERAGYQLVSDSGLVGGDVLKSIPYTDANGQVDTFAMNWLNDVTGDKDLHPVSSLVTDRLILSKVYDAGLNPNEICGLSFHEHLITDRSNLIIHSHLLENNNLVKEFGARTATLYYYAGTVKFSKDDDYLVSGYISTGTYSFDTLYKTLTISGVPSGSSWALVDDYDSKNYITHTYIDSDMNTIYINNLEDRPNTTEL